MKGKRWELPQKFRTIYWQNFALTASIVMLTLALLGASFFALSYAYAADERSDEMAQKASVVARLVASYASSGDVRDMREMAGVAASMTDVDFLVCSTEGSVLLTTDENLVDHVLTVPSDVMETALSGERYSARTTLGGIYESKRFVVGVPIESDIWTVGAVFAVTETGRLTTMWRAFFAMFLMTSVIVLLLSFVASAWVSMRQSRPIREMAAATRAFAEGNFDTRMHDYGAGEIGELAIIRVCHMTPGLAPGEGHEYEGPAFHDCGMHYVDIARWYARSEYKTWNAQAVRMWNYKDPWWLQCHGTFENGVVFDITQGHVYGQLAKDQTHNSYIDIIGTKGIARMTHDFKTAVVELHGVTQTHRIERPFGGKNIDVLCDLFAQSLETGVRNESLPSFRDAAIASEYAWRFLQDARTHDMPAIGDLGELEEIRDRRRTMKNGYGLLRKRA